MKNFDPEEYAAGIRRANEREETLIKSRQKKAMDESRRLAALIKAYAGVSEVILFGSLAEGTVRRLDFDIDLAIRGGDYFKAAALVEDNEFSVDLVDYADLPAHIRDRIDRCGVVL